MLERTDVITNEVLEPITFFLAYPIVQGDSLARGPKLLSIKNYVIEIMT